MCKQRELDASEVLRQLEQREPIFHRPQFGTTRAAFEALLAPDFWEVGASGRQYSREFVLDLLEKRSAEPHHDVWETSEFRCQRLAQDLYLLTYTLVQPDDRKTRRTTIWQRSEDGWLALFHQGTVVTDQS